MGMKTIDPTSGETIATWEETSPEGLERALAAGDAAHRAWREVPFGERAERMREAARRLEEGAGGFAETMAREMGKPVAQGRSETEKCAWVCRHYADHAEAYLADETIETESTRSYVAYRPLGLVLAIMPWNFPFWQVFRFAAPGLMAGNAALLKHAPNVLGCAEAIEGVFTDAGFPDGLFQHVVVDTGRVEAILDDRRVAAATLTGSVGAGKAVASIAGARVKKTVLELGGSDPYLVLEDADVEAAAKTCAKSRLINSGQSCIAAKRFVVPASIRQRFEEALVEAMGEATMGDPREEGTDVGPQAREDLRDKLAKQVEDSVAVGARCLLGGEVPDRAGWWYPPTVLAHVHEGMPAYDEEVFGPVAAVIEAEDEEDAVRIANDTPFGLGAAVFSADAGRAERIARDRLEAGCCFVNDHVRSDPRLPFGGVKQSGYGRELARPGIREFTNAKTVVVA